MTMADELLKLEQLRQSGALSQAEFDEAKKALLRSAGVLASPGSFPQERPWAGTVLDDASRNSIGRAMNRSLNVGVAFCVLSLIVFLIFIFVVISAKQDSSTHDLCRDLPTNAECSNGP